MRLWSEEEVRVLLLQGVAHELVQMRHPLIFQETCEEVKPFVDKLDETTVRAILGKKIQDSKISLVKIVIPRLSGKVEVKKKEASEK